MEDREFIELIAIGTKTKGDIENRLESYSNEAKLDFCMKLYGRIPMGKIVITEEYDKEGHEISFSGLTPKQEREEKNIIEALAHIGNVFGIDIFEFDEPQHENKIEYSKKLLELFKNDSKQLDCFVKQCKCKEPGYIARLYKGLEDKVVPPSVRNTKKELWKELVSIGLIKITYETFKYHMRDYKK